MSQKLQPVRGTHDLLGEAMRMHRHILQTARDITERFGFQEMAPPIFEFTDVFHRTLGESSDVVSKETYTFEDRGGESITLRPEITASVVRAFISNGLTQQLPFKAFYAGPAFRYERPQKGRQRQFHQIGIELLGADAAWHDVEVISASAQLLGALGMADKVTLELNSLGDTASREAYRAALVTYFSDHRSNLSEESQARLEVNPLRILDSKQADDQALIAQAPSLDSAFTSEASDWFAHVQKGLDALGIDYQVSPRLVRGLDYYTHTVFEWTTDALGAQNTVLAGGRYNGLVAHMGGPDIPGIGWAAGVERLSLLATPPQPSGTTRIAIIPLSEAELTIALHQADILRRNGLHAELFMHKNMGKALKKADAHGARFALLIGEAEREQNRLLLKDLKQGTQSTIESSINALLAALATFDT